MPTIQQLISSERKRLSRKTKSPALKACPERRGVCTRVYTSTPKKPMCCRPFAVAPEEKTLCLKASKLEVPPAAEKASFNLSNSTTHYYYSTAPASGVTITTHNKRIWYKMEHSAYHLIMVYY